MKVNKTVLGLTIALSLSHPLAKATSSEEFLMRNAQDLTGVCSTPSSDPLYTAAINFCEGYIEGAYHYYSAMLGPGIKPFVCLPKPEPTRDEVTRRFVAWSQAHPQHSGEPAVETLFKFAEETWPCGG